MHRWLSTSLLLALGALGCGGSDHASDTTGSGAGGAGGGSQAGGMGGGGEAACPPGSHDVGGACEAALGPFTETEAIADARDHHVTWAAKRPAGTFLYVAGGALDMTSPVTSIERSRVAEDGTLGPWEVLPGTLTAVGHMVASTDQRVFFAGGNRPGGISTKSDSAAIGDDGSLGPLEPGPEMSVPRFHGSAVLHDGWIYATGGIDAEGTSSAVVERLAVGDDGPQGAWIVEDEALPEQLSHHSLAASDDALYITGGLTRLMNDFGNDTPYDFVLRSVIQPDGSLGPWTQVGTLPFPLAVHASLVHAGQLYVMHGLDMSTQQFVGIVQRAPLLDDGTVGTWETLSSELPFPRGHCHQTPLVDGLLYSVAGTNNLGSQTNAFVALFE